MLLCFSAFKVHNAGTTFYFRSMTEEEKYEWINHLSLASIGYRPSDTPVSVASSSGIDSSYSTGTSQAYSDDEDDNSSSMGDEMPGKDTLHRHLASFGHEL